MTDQTRKSDSGYIGYEYREIAVSKEYISLCMDSYPCFGWEPDPNRGMEEEGISSAARKKSFIFAGIVIFPRYLSWMPDVPEPPQEFLFVGFTTIRGSGYKIKREKRLSFANPRIFQYKRRLHKGRPEPAFYCRK